MYSTRMTMEERLLAADVAISNAMYEILDELQEQGLIYQIPGGRSLLLTDTGRQKAGELEKKYLKGTEETSPVTKNQKIKC